VLITEGDEPNGNISSASDAIWWSLVSVTTVGYGDRFPVSSAGRLVAILIMTAGIALAGVITSYLSTVFVGQEDKNAGQKEEIASLRSELAEMRSMLETLVERER
jgi:voltage-gated potassium channel